MKKNLSALLMILTLAACSSSSPPADKLPEGPRYLFNWGFQKAKVPKKVLRKEVRRLSLSHYYHNENGATPDVVLVGRPPEAFGASLPNIFSLQIYQSPLDPGAALEPVLRKGEYFDGRSGHAEVVPFASVTAETLTVGRAYWFSSTHLDWGSGKSVFFVTQKKGSSSPSEQREKIYAHLQQAKSVIGVCSDAFVMYLDEDYSISFLHFKDNDAFEKCVFSPEGQAVIDSLKTFRKVSLVTEIKNASAQTGDVAPGEAIKVITK